MRVGKGWLKGSKYCSVEDIGISNHYINFRAAIEALQQQNQHNDNELKKVKNTNKI